MNKEEITSYIKKYITKYKSEIIIFFSVFFFRYIQNLFLNRTDLFFKEMDISSVAGAAIFSGKDWSSIIVNSNFSGWFYSFIIAPIFIIFQNMHMILLALLTVNTLFLCVISIIEYKILKEFLYIKDEVVCVFLSIFLQIFYISFKSLDYLSNETFVMLLIWTIIYVVLTIQKKAYNCENKRKSIITLFLLMVIGLLTSTSFTIIWIGLLGFFILHKLITKCSLIRFKFLISIGIMGYLFAQYLNLQVFNKVWLKDSKDLFFIDVGNDFLNLSKKLSCLLEFEGIRVFLKNIISQIYTLSIFTGGLYILFFVFFYNIVKKLIKRRTRVLKDINTNRHIESKLYMFFIFSFSFLIFFMNLILSSVPTQQLLSSSENNEKQIIIGICSNYISIILFCVIFCIISKALKNNRAIIIATVVFLINIILFYIFVAPDMIGIISKTSKHFMSLSSLTLSTYNKKFNVFGLVIISAIGILYFAINCIYIRKNKIKYILFTGIIFTIYILGYENVMGNRIDINEKNIYYNKAIQNKAIQTLEKYDISPEKYGKVYIDKDLTNYNYFQLKLHEYSLVISNEDRVCSEKFENVNIMLTNELSEELTENWSVLYTNISASMYNKQKGIFLLVRGDELKEMLKTKGAKLTSVSSVYGISKPILTIDEEDVGDIGFDKLSSSDCLKQEFSITKEMIQYNSFGINLLLSKQNSNNLVGKVLINISQNDISRDYIYSIQNIIDNKKLSIILQSKDFKEGDALITIRTIDTNDYVNIIPKTVSMQQIERYPYIKNKMPKVSLNDIEYNGILYYELFIPENDNKLLVVNELIEKSSSESIILNNGKVYDENKISQKIYFSNEILKEKYIGIDLMVKNDYKESRGIVNFVLSQNGRKQIYSINSNEINNKQYITIIVDAQRFKEGNANISITSDGLPMENNVRFYSYKTEDSDKILKVNNNPTKEKLFYYAYKINNIETMIKEKNIDILLSENDLSEFKYYTSGNISKTISINREMINLEMVTLQLKIDSQDKAEELSGSILIDVCQGEITQTYNLILGGKLEQTKIINLLLNTKSLKIGKADVKIKIMCSNKSGIGIGFSNEDLNYRIVCNYKLNEIDKMDKYLYKSYSDVIGDNINNIGNAGKNDILSQNIKITDEMLLYKNIILEFYVDIDSKDKGKSIIEILQDDYNESFEIDHSKVDSNGNIRITLDSSKIKEGNLLISIKNYKKDYDLVSYYKYFKLEKYSDMKLNGAKENGRLCYKIVCK